MEKLDIKTIEGKIRERARNAYAAEIDAAMKPIRDMCQGWDVYTGIENEKGYTHVNSFGKPSKILEANQVLGAVKDGLIARFQKEREDQAVRDFVEKVENLHTRIDELTNI
jgi:hypothetical protein